MSANPRTAKVVKHISALIQEALRTYEMESHHPGTDADRMDAVIKEAQVRAENLARFRTEFERMMAREGILRDY